MFHIITIGDSTIDTFLMIDDATVLCDLRQEHCQLCFNYADKIPIKHSDQSIGGNAVNIAIGGGKLGLKTAIATELGDDINGHVIKHELEKTGVNTDIVKLLSNKETRYSVILVYKSERTILSYKVKRNYSLPKLPATDWIYYTSLSETFENIQDKIAEHLEKHPSVRLAANPGSFQLKNNLKKTKEILPHTNLLFVNKEEAEFFVGRQKSALATFRALHNLGVKTAVITDGANGSFASNGEEMYSMPVYPLIPVEKTGAGDAYASGFLAAIIYGKSLPEAMRWGTANAGGVTLKIGGQKGLLNKAEIIKMIEKYKNIKPKIL